MAELLNHQTGLANATPASARLSRLSDLDAMIGIIASARPDAEEVAPPVSHEGLPWGWALAGTLRASSGMGLEELLDKRILSLLEPGARSELMLRVRDDDEETGLQRCAKVSAAALMKEAGFDLDDLIAASASTSDEGGGGGGGGDGGSGGGGDRGDGGGGSGGGAVSADGEPTAGARRAQGQPPSQAGSPADGSGDGIDWSRIDGPKQLLSPATLNMRKMRTSLVRTPSLTYPRVPASSLPLPPAPLSPRAFIT